jgi:hypothetical protein
MLKESVADDGDGSEAVLVGITKLVMPTIHPMNLLLGSPILVQDLLHFSVGVGQHLFGIFFLA